jgi:uncharacterized protein DUF3800
MTFYAFLDEAGEFVFRPTAGSFLVFAGVIAADPLLLSQELTALKYEISSKGQSIERFHACEDKQAIRDRVFAMLSQNKDYVVHSIIVRKNRVNPSLHRYGVYSVAYRTLLKYLVGGGKVSELHIFVDTVPDKKHQGSLTQNLKARATEVLAPKKINYTLHHHSSSSHPLLQVADYCAWAIYRKWHIADLRSYELIRGRIRNEFDIYERGDTDYY